MTNPETTISRTCTNCGENKSLDHFSKKANGKYGRRSSCKSCERQYRLNNTEKIKGYRRQYYQNNKAAQLERARQHYLDNQEEKIKYQSEYYKENRESVLAYQNDYRTKHKDKIRKRNKQYRQVNKDKISSQRREAHVYRRSNDVLYCIEKRYRSRLSSALRRGGYKKSSRACKLLGCSWEELMTHLESQFQEGMSWENRGDWHIDHIIPLASAETEEDMAALCHYTNLQPLWAEDNLSKGARLDWAA